MPKFGCKISLDHWSMKLITTLRFQLGGYFWLVPLAVPKLTPRNHWTRPKHHLLKVPSCKATKTGSDSNWGTRFKKIHDISMAHFCKFGSQLPPTRSQRGNIRSVFVECFTGAAVSTTPPWPHVVVPKSAAADAFGIWWIPPVKGRPPEITTPAKGLHVNHLPLQLQLKKSYSETSPKRLRKVGGRSLIYINRPPPMTSLKR